MESIKFNMKDFEAKSIEINDIWDVDRWFKNNYRKYLSENIYARIIEYYSSESEVFLKILSNENDIIGLLKGTLDTDINRFVIWFYAIDEKYRGLGKGKYILNSIMNYIKRAYNIKEVLVTVQGEDVDIIKFWSQVGFANERIVHNYFKQNNNYSDDLFILKLVM